MEENTWKITLADGSTIDNLKMNGNNFISRKKITEESFAGGLSEVTLECDDGTVETLHNVELVQITTSGKEYWFVLRELTSGELEALRTQARIEYIAMMTDVDLEDEEV